jgi:HAD superfamily hydrolase (TIGR01509 family)
MSKYELVIFDLDGVLVDACEWHRVALNEALKEVCDYEITLDDHHSEFNGIPTRKKLEKLVEIGEIDSDHINKIYEIKQHKTILTIEEFATKRQEKIEMIKWLKSQNMIVACFTNSIRKTALLMLQKTGIISMFDLIVTNQDVKNPKPDPEGYIKVLNHFNIDASSTVIIEDSPRGVEAARLSGCDVCVVKDAEDVNISLFTRRVL